MAYKYHVISWQQTAAPEDHANVARDIEDFLNRVSTEAIEIINIIQTPFPNNLLRLTVIGRSEVMPEAKAEAESESESEKEVETEAEPPHRRSRAR